LRTVQKEGKRARGKTLIIITDTSAALGLHSILLDSRV